MADYNNIQWSDGPKLEDLENIYENGSKIFASLHNTDAVADRWEAAGFGQDNLLAGYEPVPSEQESADDDSQYDAFKNENFAYSGNSSSPGKCFYGIDQYMSRLKTADSYLSNPGVRRYPSSKSATWAEHAVAFAQKLVDLVAAAGSTTKPSLTWLTGGKTFASWTLSQLEGYADEIRPLSAEAADLILEEYNFYIGTVNPGIQVTGGPDNFQLLPLVAPGWAAYQMSGEVEPTQAARYNEPAPGQSYNDLYGSIDVLYTIGSSCLASAGEGLEALGDEGLASVLLDGDLSKSDEELESEIEGLKEKRDTARRLMEEAIHGRAEVRFQEQCFLLAKVYDLAREKGINSRADVRAKTHKEKLWAKRLPYCPDPEAGTNASLLVRGNPYGFMNRLTQHPHQHKFFEMTSAEISSLQPMIRLFKVFEENNEEYQHEFNFDAYASASDVASLFEDREKRGFGVGIKNFSFTYDGNNPFAAKKSIKASLTIFASSFDELLKERSATYQTREDPDNPTFEATTYRYADLALKTWMGKHAWMDKEEQHVDDPPECASLNGPDPDDGLEKLNFRLKAVVGYARPVENTWFQNKTEEERQALLDAISESYVTLNLTPTIHDFKIDDMGRLTFTINYLAYVEDFYDQPQFDIFYDPEVAPRIMGRKYQYEELSKKCDANELAAWKEDLATRGVLRKDKFQNMQALMGRLQERQKIRYINMTFDELVRFETEGPFFQTSGSLGISDSPSQNIETQLLSEFEQSWTKEGDEEAMSKEIKDSLMVSLAATNPTEENLSFFYISDLVDVILEGIEDRLRTFSNGETYKDNKELATMDDADMNKEIESHRRFRQQFRKFRVVLGPVEIMDPINGVSTSEVNFGDVPISTKYFIEWLSEKMLKREETQYNLGKFLNDLLNTLVRNFLNNDSCFSAFSIKQKVRVSQAAVTSYKNDPDSKWDEMTEHIMSPEGTSGYFPNVLISAGNIATPLLNVSGPRGTPIGEGGVNNEINYLIFFAGRTQPLEVMKGNREQDAQNGIFHYYIGREKGIVKTIELSKTDAKYLKEVRFQQEGFDGLQQLREVYDVTVDCYANPKTFPGTYIFVDPRGFAPNTSKYVQPPTTSQKGYSAIGSEFDLTKYGIGGYHMIIRSEHNFGPGQAQTKLTAKWVAEIEAKQDEQECTEARAKQQEKGTNSKSKCPPGIAKMATQADESEEQGFLDSVGSWFMSNMVF